MANIYDMTDQWTDGGQTWEAIKMAVTDTASAAGSMIMDLQVGGVSQFTVSPAGVTTCSQAVLGGNTVTTTSAPPINVAQTWNSVETTHDLITANAVVTASAGNSRLIHLQASGATKFSVRATGQVTVDGQVNPLTSGAHTCGAANARWSVYFAGGNTVAASAPPIDVNQTWDAAGQVMELIRGEVTNTASSPASLLMNLLTGGVSQFSVGVGGEVSVEDTLLVKGTSTLTNVVTNGTFQAIGRTTLGELAMLAQADPPDDPPEGQTYVWSSNGTGIGTAGSLMAKVTNAGTTKTYVVINFAL